MEEHKKIVKTMNAHATILFDFYKVSWFKCLIFIWNMLLLSTKSFRFLLYQENETQKQMNQWMLNVSDKTKSNKVCYKEFIECGVI